MKKKTQKTQKIQKTQKKDKQGTQRRRQKKTKQHQTPTTSSQTPNHFVKAKCAPNPDKNSILGFSCYTSEALEKMRMLWNARHPDSLIETTDPREIWEQLKQQMAGLCNNEMCWMKQNFIREKMDNEIIHYTFAPTAPKSWKENPTEWLSSLDILNVMRQYEKRYSCFEFLGPSPIDYDKHILYGECVWEELCKFELRDFIRKNIYKIGIIFNLDPHYKTGSHWVSLFINVRTKQILYKDSYGEKPEAPILKFIRTVQRQARKLGIEMDYIYNKTRHQYGNSECGMYSLHFIIENLKDTPTEQLMDTKISDEEMVRLRNVYFNS